MQEIFSGTLLIDIVIVVTLLEWGVLYWWHRRTGRGISMVELRPTLMAGLYLMIALRASMTEAPWYVVALLLLAAGFAHISDLLRRWQA